MAKSKSQMADETSVIEDEVPAGEPVVEAVESAPEAPAIQEEKPVEKPARKAAEPTAELKKEESYVGMVRICYRAYAGQKVTAGSVVAEFDSEGVAEVAAENADLFLRIPGFSRI